MVVVKPIMRKLQKVSGAIEDLNKGKAEKERLMMQRLDQVFRTVVESAVEYVRE